MDGIVTVIGGGLAGSEAAWQIARAGVPVRLYEMRPLVPTPAHTTDRLGELVCSNSLKSDQPGTAPFLLKEELRRLDSLLLRIADEVKVPAGHALAVDREKFSRRLTSEISDNPRIRISFVIEQFQGVFGFYIPGGGVFGSSPGARAFGQNSENRVVVKYISSDHQSGIAVECMNTGGENQ